MVAVAGIVGELKIQIAINAVKVFSLKVNINGIKYSAGITTTTTWTRIRDVDAEGTAGAIK